MNDATIVLVAVLVLIILALVGGWPLALGAVAVVAGLVFLIVASTWIRGILP